MFGAFTRFRIEALHGRYNVDIPIEDNKLVLVGENGTGKSTVASLIFLFLTRQWSRLAAYDFESITAVINSEQIELTKDEIVQAKKITESSWNSSNALWRRYNETIRLQEAIFQRELFERELSGTSENLLEENSDQTIVDSASPISLEKINESIRLIKSLTSDKILYLPTYRRIEQDLAAIFPGRESSPEQKRVLERLQRRARDSEYIELVEFGMQDVKETITRKMEELDKGWRADLTKFTSTYLRDIISGAYRSTHASTTIGELDEATINTVFSRIDQSVLPTLEQQRLKEIIDEIKEGHDFSDEDRVAIHYLTQLIELHKKQQEKEKDVQDFVAVCNRYLSRKEFVYDNINFSVLIRLKDLQRHDGSTLLALPENSHDELEMSKLSSGEKQIVSLFSQIYLSGSANYFVIIDEPELSLSVPWQKWFLPDIFHTGRCSGLIAVTHSPFIFDNELDEYARSLEKFMEPVG